jgi:ankyrin repeat protein
LTNREGRTAIQIAARRGRADALDLFERRGAPIDLTGLDALLGACVRDNEAAIAALTAAEPGLTPALIAEGGTALAEFSGNGNLAGVRRLLALGVNVDAPYRKGDAYFGVAPMSTALQVAAWRAEPEIVGELIARGASIEAADAEGRTALQLAVRACVHSAWAEHCPPDCVRALIDAGAAADGIGRPTGHAEIDRLLSRGASP